MNWFEKLLAPGLLNKLAIAKLRVELSVYEGRFEALESRLSDLADRFGRFQNREGMRAARAKLEVDDDLAQEAASILARSEAPEGLPGAGATISPSKADLWAKRRKLS